MSSFRRAMTKCLSILAIVGVLITGVSSVHAQASTSYSPHNRPDQVLVVNTAGELNVVSLSARMLLTSRFVIGSIRLEAGRDYVPFDVGADRTVIAGAEVIYGGVLEDPRGHIDPEQARGKVVVFTSRKKSGFTAFGIALESPWIHAAAIVTLLSDDAFPQVSKIASMRSFVVSPRVGDPVSMAMRQSAAVGLFDQPLDTLVPGAKGNLVIAEFEYATH